MPDKKYILAAFMGARTQWRITQWRKNLIPNCRKGPNERTVQIAESVHVEETVHIEENNIKIKK